MDINDRDAEFEKSTKRLQVLKEGWKSISTKKSEVITEDAKAVQAQLKKKNAPTPHKAVHVLEEDETDPKLEKDPLTDLPGTPPPDPITPEGSPVTPTDVGAATAPPSPEAAAISPTPDATSTPAPTDAAVTPPVDAAAVAPGAPATPATPEQQATQLFANTALANVPPDILNMSTLSNAVNPDGVFLASIVDATNNNKPYTLLVVPGSDFQAAKGDTPDTFVISKPTPPAEIATEPVVPEVPPVEVGVPPTETPPAEGGVPAETPAETPPDEIPPEEEPKEEPVAEEKECAKEEKEVIDESEAREDARDPIKYGKKDWKSMIQKILKEGAEKKTDKSQDLKDQIKKLETEKENENAPEEKKAIQGEIDGLKAKLKKIEDENSPARQAAKALAAKSAEKTKEEIAAINKGKEDSK